MRAAFKTAVDADGTLSALLGTRTFTAKEVSRYRTPDAFDANSEIQPSLLIKEDTDVPEGPVDVGTMLIMNLYLYERDSYDTIDQCVVPLRALFDKVKVGSGNNVFESRWIGSVLQTEDEALRCNMHILRFRVIRLK